MQQRLDAGVAVEDGAARVAGQAHGDPLGPAGADQGAGGGAGTRGGALLHEYPVGVGRFGPHFS